VAVKLQTLQVGSAHNHGNLITLKDRIAAMRDLSDELRSRARHYRHLGQANFAGAVTAFLGALGTSTLATVFARQGATWLPWIAALPGVIVLMNGYFKFDVKSLWHFEKSRRLDAIQRQVEFAALPPKEAIDWWNKTDELMDEKWPSFGPFSGFLGPTGHRPNRDTTS
jgi:hypothetical protein